MLSIRNYVRPQTIEEAYEYAKKPLSVVLGGMLWLKMQNRNVNFYINYLLKIIKLLKKRLQN